MMYLKLGFAVDLIDCSSIGSFATSRAAMRLEDKESLLLNYKSCIKFLLREKIPVSIEHFLLNLICFPIITYSWLDPFGYRNHIGFNVHKDHPLMVEVVMATKTPDDQICQYWARFTESDLIEVKAIHVQETTKYWIHLTEWEGLVIELKKLNHQAYDILSSVNSRARQSSSELDVSQLVSFYADVDSVKILGNNLAIPLPSLVVSSGHGYHLYWYTADPIPVNGGNRDYLRAINRGLAKAVGGDSTCSDLSRMLRIPGFTNHKPPSKPVRIIAHHPFRYDLRELEAFAVELPKSQKLNLGPIPEVTKELKQKFDEARQVDESGEMRKAWRGDIGDGSSDSRYVLVLKLKESRKFTDEEIVSLVCSRNWFNRRSKQHKDPEAVLEDAIRLVRKAA
jgi:hypothetical protein